MKQAAGKFIGEYDFRNFCKMDAANVNNYRRKITFFDISPSKKRYVLTLIYGKIKFWATKAHTEQNLVWSME